MFHLLRHKLQFRYPIVERRPFKSVRDLGALLQPLSRQQCTELYGRLFVPINLNTATDAEILTIPGVGQRMLREFKKYRPYKSMDEFRREIGKYVSGQEVAPLALRQLELAKTPGVCLAYQSDSANDSL